MLTIVSRPCWWLIYLKTYVTWGMHSMIYFRKRSLEIWHLRVSMFRHFRNFKKSELAHSFLQLCVTSTMLCSQEIPLLPLIPQEDWKLFWTAASAREGTPWLVFLYLTTGMVLNTLWKVFTQACVSYFSCKQKVAFIFPNKNEKDPPLHSTVSCSWFLFPWIWLLDGVLGILEPHYSRFWVVLRG